MAAITISAQLTESDIKRAAGEVEKTFKKAFDAVSEHAREQFKRVTDAFGGEDAFRRTRERAKETGDALGRAERQALQLAQAQARLLTATGDLAGAQRTLAAALDGVEKESLAVVRAQTQLAQVESKLARETTEAQKAATKLTEVHTVARREVIQFGRDASGSARIARESFITASSEIIESWGVDGDIANEIGKMLVKLPKTALLGIGAVVAALAGAAAAVAGLVITTQQMVDVAGKVGTKNKDDFDEFARAVEGAGGRVTRLDRAMSQELLRTVEQVKAGFDNLFLVMLRESGPQLIVLLRQVTKLMLDLIPLAQQFGGFLANSFIVANAAMTTFIKNAGKGLGALFSLISSSPLQIQKGIQDLIGIKDSFDASIDQAVRDSVKLQSGGFKAPVFKTTGDGGKALRGAQLSEVRSALDKELQIYREFAREQQQILKESYDAGLVTTQEYFNNRQLIADSEFAKIVEITKKEVAAIQDAITHVKRGSVEEINLRKALNETYADGVRQLQKLTAETIKNAAEFKKAFALPKDVDFSKQVEVITSTRERRLGGNLPEVFTQAADKIAAAREALREFGELEQALALRREQIETQVVTGSLTQVEARRALIAVERQYRDALIARLEIQKQGAELKDQIKLDIQIEQLKTLGLELSNGERFAKGFGSQIEAVGDIFDRFGQNVARALTNVRDLFNGLKQAVLQFFNDLLGNTLQNLLRGTFKALGGLLGGVPGANRGGGFASIADSFGNIFRTPSFNQSAGGGFNAGSLVSLITGGGGGVSTPTSITGGLPSLPGVSIPSLSSIFGNPGTGSGAITRAFGGGGFSFGGIFGNLEKLFGGGGGASLGLSFLGAGLGSLLGRGSIAGSILSGIGGALIASGPGAIFGIPLLIAGALLGRAARRRKDESTSGDYLQQAIDSIRALKKDVLSDRVVGESEARKIFNDEILKTFIDQINTIKTKSVRESRLTNQTRDLKKLFEDEVIPAILEQSTRRKVAEKLIPEFATGGFTRGGLAFLHDGEAILNRTQQARLFALTSPSIFQTIGVPNAPARSTGGFPAFETGGFYRSGGASAPLVVNIDRLSLQFTEGGAVHVLEMAVSTDDGRRAVVGTVRNAELRSRG